MSPSNSKPTGTGYWWTRKPGGSWFLVTIESGGYPDYGLYVLHHKPGGIRFSYYLDSYYKENEWFGPILPPDEVR